MYNSTQPPQQQQQNVGSYRPQISKNSTRTDGFGVGVPLNGGGVARHPSTSNVHNPVPYFHNRATLRPQFHPSNLQTPLNTRGINPTFRTQTRPSTIPIYPSNQLLSLPPNSQAHIFPLPASTQGKSQYPLNTEQVINYVGAPPTSIYPSMVQSFPQQNQVSYGGPPTVAYIPCIPQSNVDNNTSEYVGPMFSSKIMSSQSPTMSTGSSQFSQNMTQTRIVPSTQFVQTHESQSYVPQYLTRLSSSSQNFVYQNSNLDSLAQNTQRFDQSSNTFNPVQNTLGLIPVQTSNSAAEVYFGGSSVSLEASPASVAQPAHSAQSIQAPQIHGFRSSTLIQNVEAWSFCQPENVSVFDNSERAEYSQTLFQPEGSPSYVQPEGSPTFAQTEGSPSPTFVQPEGSPTFVQPEGSPSPTFVQSKDSQTFVQSEDSLTFAQSEDSSTFAQSEDSQTFVQSKVAQTFTQSEGSQTFTRSEGSPRIEDDLTVALSEDELLSPDVETNESQDQIPVNETNPDPDSQDEEFSESSEESGTPNPRPSLHTTDSNRENETYVSNNVINVESRQNASNASSEYLFNVSNVQQSSYNVPSGHQLQPSQNQILNSGSQQIMSSLSEPPAGLYPVQNLSAIQNRISGEEGGPAGLQLHPSGEEGGPAGLQLHHSGEEGGPAGLQLHPSGGEGGPAGLQLHPSSDIPDLRQQFLANQNLPLPGQMVVLPPLSEDRSIQMLQLLTPTQQGDYTTQTIVLPIMKVGSQSSENTPALPLPQHPLLQAQHQVGLPEQHHQQQQVTPSSLQMQSMQTNPLLPQAIVSQQPLSEAQAQNNSTSLNHSHIRPFQQLNNIQLQMQVPRPQIQHPSLHPRLQQHRPPFPQLQQQLRPLHPQLQQQSQSHPQLQQQRPPIPQLQQQHHPHLQLQQNQQLRPLHSQLQQQRQPHQQFQKQRSPHPKYQLQQQRLQQQRPPRPQLQLQQQQQRPMLPQQLPQHVLPLQSSSQIQPQQQQEHSQLHVQQNQFTLQSQQQKLPLQQLQQSPLLPIQPLQQQPYSPLQPQQPSQQQPHLPHQPQQQPHLPHQPQQQPHLPLQSLQQPHLALQPQQQPHLPQPQQQQLHLQPQSPLQLQPQKQLQQPQLTLQPSQQPQLQPQSPFQLPQQPQFTLQPQKEQLKLQPQKQQEPSTLTQTTKPVKLDATVFDSFVLSCADDDETLLNQVDETGLPKIMQGIDLDRIKQFAAEFRSVRISLGLTQTQVGLALQTVVGEGTIVSQSTICRFEKLEITALQVKRLLPVLQSWLSRAKEQQRLGIPIDLDGLLPSQDGQEVKRRKRRTVFSEETVSALNQEFAMDQNPDMNRLHSIANLVGLERETVRVWFSNRRQTERKHTRLLGQNNDSS